MNVISRDATMNVVSREMTADEEDVKSTEMMMSASCTVEMLVVMQEILAILVIWEITEIEEGVMIKDGTNVQS